MARFPRHLPICVQNDKHNIGSKLYFVLLDPRLAGDREIRKVIKSKNSIKNKNLFVNKN